MTNLTTVAGVNLYTGTTGNDKLVAALIPAASAAALRYIGLDLFQATYSEVYPGTGTKRLILRQGPVTAVTSVSVNGYAVPLSTNEWMPGYVWDSLGLWRIGCAWPQKPNVVAVTYTAGYPPLAVTDDLLPIPSALVMQTQNPYWQADVGVSDANGNPLTKVASAPTTGQYSVDSQGNYTFNTSDQGTLVAISYTAIGVPADIVQAVNEIVALEVKRRTTIDVRSKSIDGQTISYITGQFPPSAMMVLDIHKRTFPVPA